MTPSSAGTSSTSLRCAMRLRELRVGTRSSPQRCEPATSATPGGIGTPRRCYGLPPIGTRHSTRSSASSPAGRARSCSGVPGRPPTCAHGAGASRATRRCSSARLLRRFLCRRSPRGTSGPCIASELAQWERIAIEAYPLPELAELPTGAMADASLLRDARLRFVTGHLDHEIVSAAIAFVDHGLGLARLRHDAGQGALAGVSGSSWQRRGSARCPISGLPGSSATSADPAPNDSASSPFSASPCGSAIVDATTKAIDPGGTTMTITAPPPTA